jgi:hypothetical protein
MQPKYVGRPPGPIATNPFERSLRLLLGRPTRASVCALLGNRAPYTSVKDWRNGRRRPPEWAARILAAAIASQQAEATAGLLERVQAATRGNARPLLAWQHARAAAKEKAGD